LSVLLAAPWSSAHADLKVLGRANCLGLINESVTYDRPQLNPHWMQTTSTHVPLGAINRHSISTPRAYTWRSYAGDIGDRTVNTVVGSHFFVDYSNVPWTLRVTAYDCNLTEW